VLFVIKVIRKHQAMLKKGIVSDVDDFINQSTEKRKHKEKI